jgi:hypothetical protein
MYVGFHVKYPLLVSDCKGTWVFLTDFRKISQIPNLMEIRSVGANSFHTDGETDKTKLTVAIRNFANAPKIRHIYHCRFL